MKYKNFKWKFANSIIILIGIVFGIIFSIGSILFLILKEYKTIILLFLVLLIMIVPSYILALIIGNKLYHNTNISIRSDGIYQNKRLLKYSNIKEIKYHKLGFIYYFEITPIKDDLFVSQKILLYFDNKEEIYYFIILHGFSNYLSDKNEYYSIAGYIKSVIDKNGENLDPYFVKIFNEHRTICPCCNNRTIFKKITNDICPVCYWEKDDDVLHDSNAVSGVNHISLAEAINNYEKLGACREEFKELVRKPFSYEKMNKNI